MTLQAFVRNYLTTPDLIRRWNEWPVSKRKAHVKAFSKNLTKQKNAAKKAAKKAVKQTASKAATRDTRRDAGSYQNFWKTSGPLWGDGSPMQ